MSKLYYKAWSKTELKLFTADRRGEHPFSIDRMHSMYFAISQLMTSHRVKLLELREVGARMFVVSSKGDVHDWNPRNQDWSMVYDPLRSIGIYASKTLTTNTSASAYKYPDPLSLSVVGFINAEELRNNDRPSGSYRSAWQRLCEDAKRAT